jgi:hypothetical protein
MNQRTRITFTLSLGLAVAAFNYASADESKPPSLYVTDQALNTVNEYDAITGTFQRVLIPYPGNGVCIGPGIPPAGCLVGPNGIIVINENAPQLLIANQNVNLNPNGDIRVFVPGLPVFPVPSIYGSPPKPMPMANDPNSPIAPFGILLYGTEILITDEAGAVKVFDTRTATFLPDLDITGYLNLNPPRRLPSLWYGGRPGWIPLRGLTLPWVVRSPPW